MLPPRLTSSGLLLIFLAGVMCLCSVLGYQKLSVSGPATPLEAHQTLAQKDPAAGGLGDHSPAGLFYTVLFMASLGAALRLLLGRGWRPPLVRTPAAAPRFMPPSILRFPSQAPPRARLQVFLL